MIAYLAGPEVFLPDAVEQGERKKAICARYGITGLFPLDKEVDLSRPDASKVIFEANDDLIRQADVVIANLTPYPAWAASGDAGTIWELGCAYGMGKPCYGYTNDPRMFEERFRTYLRDIKIGFTDVHVEQFGNIDNLMIDESAEHIEVGNINMTDQASVYYHDLTAFERCVQRVAARQEKTQDNSAR